MSQANTPSFPDFGKLVPGFDFLQNLAKQAAGSTAHAIPQLPNLGNWIAPTLNVEELDKRVQELKAVQFWLDQNAAALKATIQALEVQKMTLATLKSMNFQMPSAFGGASQGSTPAAPSAAPEQSATAPEAKPAGPAVDPMRMWNALTQQFQNIAGTALKDVGTAASQAATKPAPSTKKPAAKTTGTRAATRAAAKKTAPSRTRKRA